MMNPYEALHRERKARAIADYWWSHGRFEHMGDATDTTECEWCADHGVDESGGDLDCPVPECYRGRVRGYRSSGAPVALRDDEVQWVDRWLDRPTPLPSATVPATHAPYVDARGVEVA